MEYPDAELYLEEYYRHMAAGDDPDMAKLRIIEQGCPVDVAQTIQDAALADND